MKIALAFIVGAIIFKPLSKKMGAIPAIIVCFIVGVIIGLL